MKESNRNNRLARQIAGWAGARMAALNLLLFLLFGALYISRGIQLRLVDPLAQARDRLIRKISDGELLLADLPEDGLGEELRFLRTLEQSGPDLAVLLEDGRAVYYDETQDAMREGAIPDPFADARPLSGIQFRIDPIHGWMALTSTQVDDPAELAWELHRNYWKKGYGTEIGRTLLRLGFEILQLRRITADCNTLNIGSYRIMEKIGMRREAHYVKLYRGNSVLGHAWCDKYLYAILRDEYLSMREKEGVTYDSRSSV